MDILISNSQLVRCLGTGAISASDDSNRLLSFAPSAELLVRKALGAETFAYLKITNISQIAAMSTEKKALFDWVERAVAFYTYSFYLPFALGTEGDNGLQEVESDKTKPVRMGVLDKRLNATPELAAEALEEALRLLYEKVSIYTFWATSEAYGVVKSLFIRFGSDLGKFLPPSLGTYLFFGSIRQFLADAERDLAQPLLGLGLFNALKTKQLAGTLSVLETELLGYVCRFVAWAAYLEALDFLVVVVTSGGKIRVASEFDGINNRKAPTINDMADLKLSVERKRDEYRGALIGFLIENKTALPLWASGGGQVPGSSQPNFLKKYKRVMAM